MGLRIKTSTINKGVIISIILSAGVMVGILILTKDKNTNTWQGLSHGLSEFFKTPFWILVVVLGILRWYADGMAFVTMAKHGSRSTITPGRAAVIRLEGSLVGCIVPVLVGNFSMHAYLLHKEKLKIHESMAITVLRTILPIFLFILNVPIFLLMQDDLNFLKSGSLFNNLIIAISLAVIGIVITMIITLFYPKRIKHLANIIVRWCTHIKIIRKERLFAIRKKLFREINQFSRIFWTYLRGRKLMLLGATAWIVLSFIMDYLIAICILWGFNVFPSLWETMAYQNIIRPVIFFALTPGGVGVGELTYLAFFSKYLEPDHQSMIGIAVLIWRAVLMYLPSIVGFFFMMREFKVDKRLKETMLKEGHPPGDGLIKDMDDTNDEGAELNQ